MVKALAKADKAFAIKANLETSPPANNVNNLVRIINIAQPGGCPISNLYPVAMNSPQSQRLAVGSRVHKYVNAAIAKTTQPVILFTLLKATIKNR